MEHTEAFGLAVLICALAIAVALLYNRISDKVRIPAPAVFLIVAAIVSNFFPVLESVDRHVVQDIVTVVLVIILFDGGMHIGWKQFRGSAGSITTVGVVGTFLTTAAVAALAHYLFGLDWILALVLGTAIAPTDPAVVFSVLGKREIAGRAGTILEGESGANDPVGIALMGSVLAAAASGTGGFGVVGEGALAFVLEIVVGAVIGFVGGLGLLFVMRHWPLPSDSLYLLRTLAGGFMIFGLATVAHGSGFLAVFVAGVVIGDSRAPYKQEIERFHSALASLGEIVAFTVLGLTVDVAVVWQDGSVAVGVGIAALLGFVVRPLLVGALVWPVRLRNRERAFVLWSGLKGAVPVLLGTFALTAGLDGAHRLYDIIFVVVAFSVIVQGGLVPTVAARLGISMHSVGPEPFTVGVRLENEPESVRRFIVQEGAAAEGRAISDLLVDEGFWISLVIRDGDLVTVSGDTTLRPGDEVVALVDPEGETDLADLFCRDPEAARAAEPAASAPRRWVDKLRRGGG